MARASSPPAMSMDTFRRSARPAAFAEGFYDEEHDELVRFRWMGSRGVIGFAPPAAAGFLELWVLSPLFDLSQELTVDVGGGPITVTLTHGWSRVSFAVEGHAERATLTVNRPFPRRHYPGDPRTLAVRARDPVVHTDAERHRHVVRQHANLVRNTREMLRGAALLESTPPQLGIDLHGACNVKPPCVYCEWHGSKAMEGDNVDVPFTLETLDSYGPFFDNAWLLINCSVGEPFMLRDLDRLLDRFGDQGKVLEMSTNGQILTDRNISTLLGRDIELYISLDAATAETYARLRNDRFETVLDNVRRLVAAKGGRGGLPRIHFVFMPMRCNVHELEQFVTLCASCQVDRMVLRPLQRSGVTGLEWERGGHRFVYREELLPFAELVRVSASAARLCRRYGVQFSDQMDFGGALAELFEGQYESEPAEEDATGRDPAAQPATADNSAPAPGPAAAAHHAAHEPPPGEEDRPSLGDDLLPVCQEPWRTAYILRRGVLPCCYGGSKVAPMDGFNLAWNSPLLQSIRAALADGRFHRYCLDSTNCPIVQKAVHAKIMPLGQRLGHAARRAWRAGSARLLGVPMRVKAALVWLAIRLRSAATDPSYRRRHLARMLGRRPPGSHGGG